MKSSYVLLGNKSTNVVTVLAANGTGDYNIASTSGTDTTVQVEPMAVTCQTARNREDAGGSFIG